MTRTVFLAGAAGAIGRCLVPRLIAENWRVVGTTRSPARADQLRGWGAEPVIVDVYDPKALRQAVDHARPLVVIHQLTALSNLRDPARSATARAENARIRIEGTRNLITAAVEAGVVRFIAQSVSFAYAPGPQPYCEHHPLDVDAQGDAAITPRGVASLETQVLAAPLHGIVLRFGRFYGPGTGVELPPKGGPVHVEEAAAVTCLALMRGAPGIYNVAEDDGFVDVSKARREFGWNP